jgi:hypothetical protein
MKSSGSFKEKQKVFTDKDGKQWSEENLQDLIDAIRLYKEFREIVDYYDYNL